MNERTQAQKQAVEPMHSALTPDQQAMLQAAIGGTELKDRPVPYLAKQQRDELLAETKPYAFRRRLDTS